VASRVCDERFGKNRRTALDSAPGSQSGLVSLDSADAFIDDFPPPLRPRPGFVPFRCSAGLSPGRIAAPVSNIREGRAVKFSGNPRPPPLPPPRFTPSAVEGHLPFTLVPSAQSTTIRSASELATTQMSANALLV